MGTQAVLGRGDRRRKPADRVDCVRSGGRGSSGGAALHKDREAPGEDRPQPQACTDPAPCLFLCDLESWGVWEGPGVKCSMHFCATCPTGWWYG